MGRLADCGSATGKSLRYPWRFSDIGTARPDESGRHGFRVFGGSDPHDIRCGSCVIDQCDDCGKEIIDCRCGGGKAGA